MGRQYQWSWGFVAVSVLLSGCLSQESQDTDGFVETPTASQNSAPTISGAPANAVKTGENYSFTPSASDADGDALTFSIENKPRWAAFNTNTGRLSGQPLLGDEGVYSNITITASDGKAKTSLRAFSVEVTQVALGSMTLNWAAPTQNADGSTLTDLAGYYIYYGETWGNYPNRIRIDNPGLTTYIVENLLPRTYYVVATSFNSAGVESGYSNVATKLVTGS